MRRHRAQWLLGAIVLLALTGCSLVTPRKAKLAVASPPPFVVPSTTTTMPWVTYTVRQGDTLTAIAARYGVQVSAIAAADHLTNLDVLTVGEVLHFPPPPPFALTVTPKEGPAGTSFELQVTGLQPSDTATFAIAAKGHAPYTGPPHTPDANGSVSANYQTWPYDPVGLYTVLAHATSGKGAFVTFRVDEPTPTTLSP